MRAAVLVLVLLVPAAVAQAPETGPFGFHLGLSADGDALALQWFTRIESPTHAEVRTAAGSEAGSYDGSSELLPQGGEYVHSVELKGLVPGEYEYEVDGAEPVAFRVPGAGLDVRLAFLADQGVGTEAAAVTALIADQEVDAVLHAGDIAYAEGDPTRWDAWFEQVEGVAASRPWLPALGNHETYYFVPIQAFVPLYGQPNPEFEAARARFSLPNDEVFWSWDVGPVHVVAIDTFWTDLTEQSPEAAWLATDLAEAADAPWTVVVFHDPPFSSGANHGSNEALRAVLAPIFEANGVDLVVNGHDHTYERTWPLEGDSPVATASPFVRGAGPVYVVSGGGGAELYEFQDQQPPWSAVRAREHHALIVDANATTLVARAVKPDGGVLDTFTIQAPAPSGAAPGAPPAKAPGPALWAVLVVVSTLAVSRRHWRRAAR